MQWVVNAQAGNKYMPYFSLLLKSTPTPSWHRLLCCEICLQAAMHDQSFDYSMNLVFVSLEQTPLSLFLMQGFQWYDLRQVSGS
jgi:hypothetical protein